MSRILPLKQLFFAFLSISMLCTTCPVLAAYTVDPLLIETDIPSDGSPAMASIRIENTGEETIRLKAYLSNWQLDETGTIQPGTAPGELNINELIRFNPKEFEIQPQGYKVVRLAINIPPGSPDGEYRSMLYFEDQKTEEQHLRSPQGYGASVQIKQRLGLALYVYKGQSKPVPQIQAFSCEVKNGQLDADIQLNNSGNRHARVTASLLLAPKDGKGGAEQFKEFPVNGLQEMVLLPNQKRKIRQLIPYPAELPASQSSTYDVQLVVSPSKKEKPIDPVTATSSLRWSSQSP